MQQAEAAPPSPTSTSFASLLAALAAPAPKPAPAWSEDELSDDVATLSYERALRAHARYKPPQTGDWLRQPAAYEPIPVQDAPPAPAAAVAPKPASPTADWHAEAECQSVLFRGLDQDKKCASITIRLSQAECVQLRRRAAEAGLTVSAYLRSCTFEAEALRRQVKDTLIELRKATAVQKQPSPLGAPHPWLAWLRKLVPLASQAQRVARA